MSHLHETLVKRVHLVDIAATRWCAAKSVLRCIAGYASEASGDTAWPGVELMMIETGMSESAVINTTTLLVQKGWITSQRRPGSSNRYRLNVARLRAHQIEKTAPGVDESGQVHTTSRWIVPGRSTARERTARQAARRAEAAAARPLVDFTEQPQVTTSYADPVAAPDPVPPQPNTSNPRNRTRRFDVTEHVGSTTESVVTAKRTNRQHAHAPRGRATTATACLPAGIASTRKNPRWTGVSAHVTASAGPQASAAEQLLAGLALPWPGAGGVLLVDNSVIRGEAAALNKRLDEGGWTCEAMAAAIRTRFSTQVDTFGGPANIGNVMGVLRNVLRDIPLTAHAVSAAQEQVGGQRDSIPWCGACDADNRWITEIGENGRPRSYRCPDCHPVEVAKSVLVS
ncbi:hypothetical protein ACQP2U_43710 (plasmid) [Nocardia sp. CA-084685]|uniref:hypothetical protein n=1 Tax=Nocardia sp. CA-084685 TaxID=3239970 RepID=UPI003D967CE1